MRTLVFAVVAAAPMLATLPQAAQADPFGRDPMWSTAASSPIVIVMTDGSAGAISAGTGCRGGSSATMSSATTAGIAAPVTGSGNRLQIARVVRRLRSRRTPNGPLGGARMAPLGGPEWPLWGHWLRDRAIAAGVAVVRAIHFAQQHCADFAGGKR